MKKQEICVEITNEEERLRVIKILTDAGKKIWECSNLFKIGFTGYLDINDNNNDWVFDKSYQKELITIDELEQLLNPLPELKGVEMEVSDDNKYWFTDTVFGRHKGKYIGLIRNWSYARPIQPLELTLEEVAAEFGVPSVKIVEK